MVALLPHINSFLLGLAQPALRVIQVSAKLSASVAIFSAVLDAQLEGMVVRYKLLDFLLMPLLLIGNGLFELEIRRITQSSQDMFGIRLFTKIYRESLV